MIHMCLHTQRRTAVETRAKGSASTCMCGCFPHERPLSMTYTMSSIVADCSRNACCFIMPRVNGQQKRLLLQKVVPQAKAANGAFLHHLGEVPANATALRQ